MVQKRFYFAFYMGKIIMGGQSYEAAGLSVDNWLDREDHDYRFINQKRSTPITELILHETVTRSHDATLRVLKPKSETNKFGRGLGVHFIVEHDGVVYQHGDVLSDLLWHASQHNGPSVGVEIVNPYEPRFNPKGSPWTNTIKNAVWAAGGSYVVPTQLQCEAVATLQGFLTTLEENTPSTLQIPQWWVGRKGDGFLMGRVKGAEVVRPGIYAHHNFEHADGSFPALYCFLRNVIRLEADQCYAETIRLSSLGKSFIDLSGLLQNREEFYYYGK